jgi:signal transduction histidine kinase
MGVIYQTLVEHDNQMIWIIVPAGITLASVMLGDAVHARGRWRAEVDARIVRAEAEREQQAQRQVELERLRIAHELHDVLAHTLAVINVQGGVVSDLIDDDPETARKALEEMRRASREAMAELRATVGVLRGNTPAPLTPTPGLSELDRIVESTRQAGIEVHVEVEGEARPLPPTVDLTAFRVLQESLTNVVRHASASCVQITLRFESGGLRLEVRDDGIGANGSVGPGFGLIGMRERVESLRGWLQSGNAGDKGFCVRAWLPTKDG